MDCISLDWLRQRKEYPSFLSVAEVTKRFKSKFGDRKASVEEFVDGFSSCHPADRDLWIGWLIGQDISLARMIIRLNIDGRCKNYAMSFAVIRGDLELLKFLGDNGADLKHESPFLCAVEKGNLDIVMFLIESGFSDIHTHNDYAFKAAERYGHNIVLEYLKRLN